MGRSFLLADLADARLNLPRQLFQGIIFDCDGTLVDSMPVHYVAWVESLQQHGASFDFTEELFYSMAGIREQDVVRILNERHGTDVDPEAVAEHKLRLFKKRFSQVKEVQPVAALARVVHAQGMPMSVASGSELVTVQGCLEAAGLDHLFDIIITPKLVKQGKPAPDMFLLAAERMGLAPEDCLVVEDGESGMQAARAAGMSAVFVPREVR
jgi:beta-phosphoglucomutase family hydrolase